MNDPPPTKATTSLDLALATAKRHFSAGEWDAAQFIYAQLVKVTPRAVQLHERLIDCLERLDRSDAAMAAYTFWLEQCADPLPADFDRLYLAAMRAVRNPVLPLRRRDRFHRLGELFSETASLNGCIAECGCFQGLSAHFLCSLERLRLPAFDGSGFFIFDSFAGLSHPAEEDRIANDDRNAEALRVMCQPGAFAASLQEVRENLCAFPGISFHPGWIPDAFEGLPEREYRFVNIDVDLYEPTLETLEYFFPRLCPGGLMVSDDYSWPGARCALETFAARHAMLLETTPLGQAVLRRPR
jgi:hypothetical protein